MEAPETVHTELARELGVNISLLYKWRDKARQHGDEAFPGHGHQRPEEAELTRLKRENARLKEERDFLRKAAAYFAQRSP